VRIGVDVGGTFTDLVGVGASGVVRAKVPSTPADQSRGVLAALDACGAEPGAVDALAHGMTVATNALLERRGARTALVTTEGFRDVIEIGRQARAALYDLTLHRPPALVPRDLRFTVRERCTPDGVLVPLDDDSLAACVEAVAAARPDAVAVCLLFGYLHPEHEQRVADAVARALPDALVAASHRVLPGFREYERTATTAATAYVGPLISRYLERLRAAVADAGMPEPLVMTSAGGVVDVVTAAGNAAACALSGPAGGVVGAGHVAAASGYRSVLTFDMGGTSTDVAPIVDGVVAATTERIVAGVPLGLPAVDVHTVSAGGGSIAWVDTGGALRAGPHSAGAEPGPAAYGRGGTEPTVTDANLALGYLADGARLGGEVVLRRGLALEALERLGRPLGLDPWRTAEGVIRVANAEMVRALRVISVERGLDPRDFALVAFGGAGPLHACALADELGIRTVLVPRESGVLSALGLAISDVRRDHAGPPRGDVAGAFAALERAAAADLPGAELTRSADLRYRGQAYELTVPGAAETDLVEAFHLAHERRYGYRADAPVEVVSLRVQATRPTPKPALTEPAGAADEVVGARRVVLDGRERAANVHDRERMGAGSLVGGPAIVELPEATCLVAPDWHGRIDDVGTLVLERIG
jgi:N-methylhydantoinase A